MNPAEQIPPPAYFGSLTIENVKCFKGKHEIDLSDGNGKPAMWTVILGNNNTGKTTLLRCLADLEPMKPDFFTNENMVIPKGIRRRYEDGYINTPRHVASFILMKNNDEEYIRYKEEWQYTNHSVLPMEYSKLGSFIIYGYGTSRRMGNSSIADTENQDNTETLFSETSTLINAEDWLIRVYAVKDLQPKAEETFKKIKRILISGILPNVEDCYVESNYDFFPCVKFKTDYGSVKLRELGYGYQTTLAWVLDLAKKLFERYPKSENPLHEPAIVLVDEIDLHLHPEWQRKIIQFLKKQFPKTQFIVTTHSPLIIQSMDDINLVLLEKEEDHVIIKQPDLKNYQGWTVEEILSDLMGLDNRIISDNYLKLIQQFDEALDEEDYQKAKNAYDELDKIIHSPSARKLLRIQMAGLVPA